MARRVKPKPRGERRMMIGGLSCDAPIGDKSHGAGGREGDASRDEALLPPGDDGARGIDKIHRLPPEPLPLLLLWLLPLVPLNCDWDWGIGPSDAEAEAERILDTADAPDADSPQSPALAGGDADDLSISDSDPNSSSTASLGGRRRGIFKRHEKKAG